MAKLFAGIFLTIIPVIAMLRAGSDGAIRAAWSRCHARRTAARSTRMYFWATGVLVSFLDNAPTYLVFFNTAGGDAQVLMATLAPTLAAISAGAVFMGANSYIGNAPELHGQGDRRGARRHDAELLRLHGLVGRRSSCRCSPLMTFLFFR